MKRLLVSVLLICASPMVLAQGKALHDKACMQCHSSLTAGNPNSLYTRGDRQITSLSSLHKRVEYCMQAADVGWNQQQRDAVVEYLNSEFYRF